MTVYIYSRVSTDTQTVENQLSALRALYPDAEIVSETVSGGAKHRPALERLLSVLRTGDTVVAYSVDRLGRSVVGILTTIEALKAKGTRLVLHREGADTDTLSGKFLVSIMASLAEMERGIISERTKVALAARRKAGVQLGRRREITDAQLARLSDLMKKGAKQDAIARDLGVSRGTVRRWANRVRAKSIIESIEVNAPSP